MNISIALCTYNGAPYLDAQLASIASQSMQPDELVVCDDASTDATYAIVEEFVKSAPFSVRLHRNAVNIGPASNFEKAVSLCTGDLIVLSDQDDVWLSNKIQRLVETMNAHEGAGLVFSDAILVDENLQRLGPTLWQTVRLNPIRQRKLRTGQAVDVLAKANYVTGATLAFCSKYRDVILPISPKWIHDYWIASIIGCYSPLIAIPEPLIMYRQHPENLIGQSAELKPIVGSESDIFRLHRERYQLLHERLLDLQARLMQIDDLPNKDALSARLQNRMTHVLARATLPDRRLARLPIIVRELLSGHYTRYSRRALWSALRDIVAT